MSNQITIELCTSDRARLDRLAGSIEALIMTTQHIIDHGINEPNRKPAPSDDIKEALEKAIKGTKPTVEEVTETAKNAPEEAEKPTPPITPKTEETPTVEEPTHTAPPRTVSRAELSTKVREMMTKGYKEQTKAIVKEYAPTVPGVPDDKVTECYDRLVALEG